MKILMVMILATFYGTSSFAGSSSKATIICDRRIQGDVYHLEAYLLFPEGTGSYGPIKNNFTGEMNFSFLDGTNNSVAYTQTSGYQLKGARIREPDFWIFRAVSKKGEIITVNLGTDTVSDHDNKGYLFGDIIRQNGQTYSATCRFQIYK